MFLIPTAFLSLNVILAPQQGHVLGSDQNVAQPLRPVSKQTGWETAPQSWFTRISGPKISIRGHGSPPCSEFGSKEKL
jgi:hypothetical protein